MKEKETNYEDKKIGVLVTSLILITTLGITVYAGGYIYSMKKIGGISFLGITFSVFILFVWRFLFYNQSHISVPDKMVVYLDKKVIEIKEDQSGTIQNKASSKEIRKIVKQLVK